MLEAKFMQNLARLQTTSKYGSEYLQNKWRYSQSDKYVIYHDSSRIQQKKSGEQWLRSFGDLEV